MICDRREANAMGGKTARACDGCMRKRARWYCVADDAFLCQGCDTSVHSANQLASRHERVRLETASSSNSKFSNNNNSVAYINAPVPAWHQGFTRKARTPRPQQNNKLKLNYSLDNPLVPEINGINIGSSEDNGSVDENYEEQNMVCRVPVFGNDLCNNIVTTDIGNDLAVDDYHELNDGLNDLLPSDLDLAAFAADVESLIGGSVEVDENEMIKGLDEILLDISKEKDEFLKIKKVKDEEEKGITACCFDDSGFDMTRASLNWGFQYESSPAAICEEEEEKVVLPVEETTVTNNHESKAEMKMNKLLRLNYESVISAWATQGSPWTTGTRPQFNPDDFMGSNPDNLEMGGILYRDRDGEREARVSRYREKRRTRLFSKKIRYQVRKLNAEKRPRMKGRFVKRTSSFLHGHGTTAFPNYNTIN